MIDNGCECEVNDSIVKKMRCLLVMERVKICVGFEGGNVMALCND